MVCCLAFAYEKWDSILLLWSFTKCRPVNILMDSTLNSSILVFLALSLESNDWWALVLVICISIYFPFLMILPCFCFSISVWDSYFEWFEMVSGDHQLTQPLAPLWKYSWKHGGKFTMALQLRRMVSFLPESGRISTNCRADVTPLKYVIPGWLCTPIWSRLGELSLSSKHAVSRKGVSAPASKLNGCSFKNS